MEMKTTEFKRGFGNLFKRLISLQKMIRKFLAKYNVEERKIALYNSGAKGTGNGLIGMIVVFNFDNKMGICLYKDIDKNNKLRNNFHMMFKSDLPDKYIPHRDMVTFELVDNPKKSGKQIAKINKIINRSRYGYCNLIREFYRGEIYKSNKGQFLVNFKYHQMSYRATIEDNQYDVKILEDINGEFETKKIDFTLNNRFRAVLSVY